MSFVGIELVYQINSCQYIIYYHYKKINLSIDYFSVISCTDFFYIILLAQNRNYT